MDFEEIEAEALKLPEPQRAALMRRLLDSLEPADEAEEDPIFELGRFPVDCGTPDGSENHDRYLYGSE